MPDAELVDPVEIVRTFLASKVTIPVRVRVPSPRPDAFLTVSRSGGPVVNRVLEEPLLTVQAWGKSIADASDTASAIKSAFLNDYTEMPLVRRVQILSVYDDPDPESEQPRYTVSVRLTVRARRI